MKGEELLRRMDLVEDRYIEEAEATSRKSPHSWMRAAAIAACLCLVLGGTAVFAAETLGFRITDMFTSRAEPGSDLVESGYDLAAEIQIIPIEALNPESMKAAQAQIALAFKLYQPHMSSWPGYFQRNFDTVREARDYVGHEALAVPELDIPWDNVRVDITAYNDQGSIQEVMLSTYYLAEDMSVSTTAWIWTAAFDEEAVIGHRSTEALEFTEKKQTNSRGTLYLTVASTALESGRLMMDGYLTKDGILYSIHLSYLPEDTSTAEAYLAQWADSF